MILPPTEENIARAAEEILADGVVAFPTETVYGLGGDALSVAAVEKIYQLKGRPSKNPLIVHVLSLKDAYRVADPKLDARTSARLEKLSAFWPGPLTVVLPKNSLIDDRVTAGLSTIAVRVPSHPVARALLAECKVPIAAPSANPSSKLSATLAQHVESAFSGKVAIVLDGGKTQIGLESAVVAINGEKPRLLRPGTITRKMIEEKLDEELEVVDAATSATEPLPSPGLLDIHYAPNTPLIFKDQFEFAGDQKKRIGLVAFSSESLQKPRFDYASTMVLSSSGDMSEVAANLFSAFHEMDKLGLDLILVDRCENAGIGSAIMNRLERAVRH